LSAIDPKKFFWAAATIAEMEARKIRHGSSELWIRAIQPALWLLVFGEALSKVRGIAPGSFSYIQFIAPGVLSQSVLFIAIFYGITLVWERDLGLLSKLLTTPSPQSSLVVGKTLAASIRGIFQAIIVIALALIIRVNLSVNVAGVVGVFAVAILLAMCFSSLSMLIASLLKTRERMMGVGQVITMPLFFASNAIYPISLMPSWLQAIAIANPLTYAVDALRAMLLTGDYSDLFTDLLVLSLYTVILIALASLTIKRIIQ
jgi:ABC-2 type transport system permease protein